MPPQGADEELGRPHLDFQKVNLVWMLSAWQICVNRRPHLCENIVIGTSAYEEEAEEFGNAANVVNAFIDLGMPGSESLADALDTEAEDFDGSVVKEIASSCYRC